MARIASPLRILSLLALTLATLVGCGDDDPPADTGGGDGNGIETDDTSSETSVGGNEPGEGGTDGMNDDPEGDDEARTDGSGGASTQGGQTGAAGGDSG